MFLFLVSPQAQFTIRLHKLYQQDCRNTTGGKSDPGLRKLMLVPKETRIKLWPEVHTQTLTHNPESGKASCSATLPQPCHLIQYEKEM